MHLVETSSEALMKTLAEEIPAALASYTGIIFNLREIVLCFDKATFSFKLGEESSGFHRGGKKRKRKI